LCKQTYKDFKWLIIDDGSTDNTGDIVKKWQSENLIPIQYIYKENGGLHTGYNKAIELLDTELAMCVDSDDWLPNDAVEKIVTFWNANKSEDVAGILGLDFTEEGKPLGGYLPDSAKKIKFIELGYRYHHQGDVKMVHRSELLKQVAPMPSFGKEKFFNPIYLFHKIDMNYPLLVLNDNLCYVEYQENGMTNNIFKQYVDSPKSFSEIRKVVMSRPDAPFALKFRNAIHYVSSQIMIRNKNWLKESPQKAMTVCAAPLGLLLYLYIKMKLK
jgi:glycosyltransferase involved in cell wall biosynthesis